MLKRGERGSILVESTFAILVLMGIGLSVVQVALSIYASNVVADSAHQGARAALERDARSEDASAAARSWVEGAAGKLVQDLDISTTVSRQGDLSVVRVIVTGTIRPLGPLPISIDVEEVATVTRQEEPM
jgi:Flp pilus assembly protein TadG